MSGLAWQWARRLLGSAALTLLAFNAQAEERSSSARSDIVVQALSLLGTPYRFGGSSPEAGFDCSGLVRHVFASVLSWELPRRSEEISGVGQPVARTELQPGDLVFFDTLRRAFSHVAIYIGEGRFVHAPARNGRVRIEGLDDRYWAARFSGARRMIEPASMAGADLDPSRAISLAPAPTPSLDTSLKP
jgi:cell wall-associated NlpC family hydrolase